MIVLTKYIANVGHKLRNRHGLSLSPFHVHTPHAHSQASEILRQLGAEILFVACKNFGHCNLDALVVTVGNFYIVIVFDYKFNWISLSINCSCGYSNFLDIHVMLHHGCGVIA